MKGRVLTIAGSDSGGGAGIQGDIKTITALGSYAMSAITALTAQNTTGVYGILDVPDDFIRKQITLALDDIGADAIKTGMLHTASVIYTIADTLAGYSHIPLVLDPVMLAKGGAPLLKPDAIDILRTRLIPMALLITPNIPEAEHLTNMKVKNIEDMKTAANKLLAMGPRAVLLKGGHSEEETITDLLVWSDGYKIFSQKRLYTPHTHGTGCTLASAIATGIAQGMSLPDATNRALSYVRNAIESAPKLGQGHGPLHHAHTMKV